MTHNQDTMFGVLIGFLTGVAVASIINLTVESNEVEIKPKYKIGTFIKVNTGFYTGCKGILKDLEHLRYEDTDYTYYARALCPKFQQAQQITVKESEIEVINVK